MIRFEHLSKTFQTKDGAFEALKDVSFEIEKGDIYGVIGYSGAGKSTLIRMVNALERPTSGKIFVEDKDIGSLSAKELRSLRKGIGMIFQQFNLLESKTIYDNVAIALKLNGTPKKDIETRVNELLEFVELSDKKSYYPGQLSGGQKQRVGIARALANNPSILLCDEATSALDPKTTDSILDLLKEINETLHITIVIITHEMNVIQKICNKVAVMDFGKVVSPNGLSAISSTTLFRNRSSRASAGKRGTAACSASSWKIQTAPSRFSGISTGGLRWKPTFSTPPSTLFRA